MCFEARRQVYRSRSLAQVLLSIKVSMRWLEKNAAGDKSRIAEVEGLTMDGARRVAALLYSLLQSCRMGRETGESLRACYW